MWQTLGATFGSIHFQHPVWLWLWPWSLLASGVLLGTGRLRPLGRLPAWQWTRTYRHPRHALLRRLAAQPSAHPPHKKRLIRWAQYAVFLLLVHLALAGPYRRGTQIPRPPAYRDTLFLIDTSIDMAQPDYLVDGKRVPRMNIVKSTLTHLIDRLRGSRIGLIVFSEQAFTLVPLTADHGLLKSLVHLLRPAILTGQNANLSQGLLYTLQQVQRLRQEHRGQKPTLVLISGANWTYRDTDPRAVAAYLHRMGYRLYGIGIGAPGYSESSPNPAGMVYQPPNFRLLKAIAHRGGGRFFWARDAASLQGAVQTIQSAERFRDRATPRYLSVALYQWPLLAALIWLFTLQAWPGRARRA